MVQSGGPRGSAWAGVVWRGEDGKNDLLVRRNWVDRRDRTNILLVHLGNGVALAMVGKRVLCGSVHIFPHR